MINGYGSLVLALGLPAMIITTIALDRLDVQPDSWAEIITRTVLGVILGTVFVAVGWKWNHADRIGGERIDPHRWFPLTIGGHQVCFVKLEYYGFLMIAYGCVRCFLKLSA